MTRVNAGAPDLMPVLSPGKHRNPRRGACFMEFASYLAGEPWSDHPRCTHPLLASLARMVNDCSSDEGRAALPVLVPSVVGLRSDDRRMGVLIAARAAATALPTVSVTRQRVLVTGLLASEQVLAEFDQTPDPMIYGIIRTALDNTPEAEVWARDFVASIGTGSRMKFETRTGAIMVRTAVEGIVHACAPNPDERLHDLLVTVIDDCGEWLRTHGGIKTPSSQAAARRIAGAGYQRHNAA